jgi:hypothetical protein
MSKYWHIFTVEKYGFLGGGDGVWAYIFISLSSNQVFSSQYPAFHAGLEEALPIAIYV